MFRLAYRLAVHEVLNTQHRLIHERDPGSKRFRGSEVFSLLRSTYGDSQLIAVRRLIGGTDDHLRDTYSIRALIRSIRGHQRGISRLDLFSVWRLTPQIRQLQEAKTAWIRERIGMEQEPAWHPHLPLAMSTMLHQQTSLLTRRRLQLAPGGCDDKLNSAALSLISDLLRAADGVWLNATKFIAHAATERSRIKSGVGPTTYQDLHRAVGACWIACAAIRRFILGGIQFDALPENTRDDVIRDITELIGEAGDQIALEAAWSQVSDRMRRWTQFVWSRRFDRWLARRVST